MAADFPVSIPSIQRVGPSDRMNDAGKEAYVLHNKLADEAEALAAVVGVTGSSDPASIQNRLSDVILSAGAIKSGQSRGNKRLNFDTLTGASVSGGSGITMEIVAVNVPEIGKVGNSIKITVDAGLTRTFTAPAFTAGPIPNSTLSLIMENLTTETFAADLEYAVEAGFTNRYTNSSSITQYGIQEITKANVASLNEFAVTGSPTFDALTRFRLVIAAPAGRAAVVILHGLYSSTGGVPTFEIMCDDGHISGYTELLPQLNRYKIKAGFAVIQSLVGTTNYMTEDQLQEIHDAGHDILVHGLTNLSSFGTLAAALADIDSNTAYVRGKEWRGGDLYVYPNGVSSYSTADATSIVNHLASNGFKAAYHTSGLRAHRKSGLGKYRTGRYSWAAWMAASTILNHIDALLITGRSYCLNIHSIVASGMAGDQINRADLDTILAGVATRVAAGTLNNYPPTVANSLLV